MLISILLIISVFFAFSYFILILIFAFGWIRSKSFKAAKSFRPEFVSIILPFRNEEENLEKVLSDLLNQNYPSDYYEIIAINDNSEDSYIDIFNAIDSERIQLINSQSSGKKRAIAVGIEKSKGKVIATVDADCRYGKNWLSTLVFFFQQENADLVFGPVDFENSGNVFGQMQNLEFLSLVGSGAGSAGAGNPIFCNGANLLYKKEFYSKEILPEISSGDDVFLLHSVKKNNGKIKFLKSRDAICYTKHVNGLDKFFMQRSRWGAKSVYYKDMDSLLTAFLVFFNSLGLSIVLILALFNSQFLWIFLALISIKAIADIVLFIPVLHFFKKKYLLFWFVPLEAIYIVYVSFIGIFGSLAKINWKGRKV